MPRGKTRPKGATTQGKGARPLSPKRQRFVEEYLVDFNATQAAIRAGYSKRSAYSQAFDLLKNPEVQRCVAAGRRRQAEAVEITVQRILDELGRIGFSDIGEVLDFSGAEPRLKAAHLIPEHARRAIAGVKVRRYVEGNGDEAQEVEVTEFKLWPKGDALEKLGKYLGMFVERHEHTGKDGKPLIPLQALRDVLARVAS